MQTQTSSSNENHSHMTLVDQRLISLQSCVRVKITSFDCVVAGGTVPLTYVNTVRHALVGQLVHFWPLLVTSVLPAVAPSVSCHCHVWLRLWLPHIIG